MAFSVAAAHRQVSLGLSSPRIEQQKSASQERKDGKWIREEAAVQTHGLAHRATKSACCSGQHIRGLGKHSETLSCRWHLEETLMLATRAGCRKDSIWEVAAAATTWVGVGHQPCLITPSLVFLKHALPC